MPSVELVASPVTRFPVGVLAGVLATFVMDGVMRKLPEGETPPSVAAGVLTDRRPDSAPERLGSVVHYLAGWLTGPLFVWLLYASEALVGGLPAVALATGVLYVLMVGFFVAVVLPRSRLPRRRMEETARNWAVSAAAYVAVLVLLVTLGTMVVTAL
jgi:hypothetical protein